MKIDFMLLVTGVVAISVFGAFRGVDFGQLPPMPGQARRALCGFDDPVPPQPFGQECDLLVACDACFFSGTDCFRCTKPRRYSLCGTPATQLCSNSAYVVDCGNSYKHQSATSSSECGTCVGSGSQQGDCQKNSCASTLK